MSDSAAITALVAAEELVELGEVSIEEADYISDWQRPSFDLASQTIGIWSDSGGEPVGFAMVDNDRGDAAVHPEHQRRGLGTALAAWMRECARANGAQVIGAPMPQGSAADRLLEKLGYHVRWTSWVLQLPDGATVPQRDLPAGYHVREAHAEDYPAVWTVIEDAFLEWSVREREPYDDFLARLSGRPGFEPWHVRVVTDPAGEVVAAAQLHLNEDGGPVCAYVDRLATAREHRNRGLAQALLVHTFAAGAANGAVRFELSTDSRTGALGLYERVGMSVTSIWLNRAIEV